MLKHIGKALPLIATAILLVIGTPSVSSAAFFAVPEIDPTSGISAVALLAGAVLVIRGRRGSR
jgi:hypothetical protein